MNQEDELQKQIEIYILLSQDYADTSSRIAARLSKIGNGNEELTEKLTSIATESNKLAEEITGLLKLGQKTPSDYWLESNLVKLIDNFLELSDCYAKLRTGFIENLTDPESPLLRILGGDVNAKEFDETDRTNTIMLYMNERRNHDNRGMVFILNTTIALSFSNSVAAFTI